MGALNAILSVVVTFIYSYIVKFAVKVENHSSEFVMRNSIILKIMIFRLLTSFLPLMVFTFRDQNFTLMSEAVSSAMITACILNVILLNFLPWANYQFNKFMFYRKWNPIYQKRRAAIYEQVFGRKADKNHKVLLEDFLNIDPSVQKEYLDMEKDLILEE